ncbi:GPP34-domain-containing protein [Ephemerocybe angulata]|uniref:GPP34-domain-containing protein n=1 Tax=Ephemerocybe angulata TaxID=980116 RepID=A0A8H6MCD2_9AGAR|nr:GPP34-domain-containing protein [Tulosesus angulatus]
MSSAGGLQRRRVANHSTSGGLTEDDDTNKPYSNGGSSNENGRASVSAEHTPQSSYHAGGSAFEYSGGNRIAYDPRDLVDAAGEESKVGGKLPKLTIMEEIMLLGVKDKQGYLSFWNDNISYALRGCILIELALRRRIALVKDPNRRHVPPGERLVEVINDKQTGETLLDEALRLMKGQQELEKYSVNTWVDLMSGETWNVMKIGFQLKQVRERLLKGLVDKGVLRTEKRNFLLFDMATHPVADMRVKESIINRTVSLLTSTTSAIPPTALDKEGIQCRVVRAICLVSAAYCASVLDNAFDRLGFEEREAAFGRCEEILNEFIVWPFGGGASSPTGFGSGGPATPRARRQQMNKIGMGSGELSGREAVLGLVQEAKKEAKDGDDDLSFELIAGVLEVLSKMDSLL